MSRASSLLLSKNSLKSFSTSDCWFNANMFSTILWSCFTRFSQTPASLGDGRELNTNTLIAHNQAYLFDSYIVLPKIGVTKPPSLTEQYTEKLMTTGVRQGCLLYTFLFLFDIDWLMKKTTQGKKTNIQWALVSELDDLGFRDYFPPSFPRFSLNTNQVIFLGPGTKMDLRINKEKVKSMKLNKKELNNTQLEEASFNAYQ